jgi:hypothetical protein
LIDDAEIQDALCAFVQSPEEPVPLRQMAAYVLRQKGVEVDVRLAVNGMEVPLGTRPQTGEEMLALRKEWKDVWLDVEQKLSVYGDPVLVKARTVWLAYLKMTMQQPPRIVKVQSWSASIAYIALNQLNLPVTQGDIAALFGVSSATVSKISRRITKILEELPEGSV